MNITSEYTPRKTALPRINSKVLKALLLYVVFLAGDYFQAIDLSKSLIHSGASEIVAVSK